MINYRIFDNDIIIVIVLISYAIPELPLHELRFLLCKFIGQPLFMVVYH